MAIPIRHELKFYINPVQLDTLRRALQTVLTVDENADENNEYHIRSLYFDTFTNSALTEKIAGVANRNKYRIRIYNLSDRFIRLERKSKYNNYISKRSATISRDLAEQLMASDPAYLDRENTPLLQEMFREMRLNLLKPVVIVDYVREAYKHPAENVRITFDKQLRTGLSSFDLFNPHIPTIPVFRRERIILEVKFDRVLPPYLSRILSLAAGWSVRSAISKYTLCRSYEGMDY